MNIIIFFSLFLFSSELRYGPYINMATDSSINLRYGLSNPQKSWLSWGINPKCDIYLTFFAPQKNINTTLYGLQPEKEYCYVLYLPVENSTYSYIASSSTFYTLNNSSSPFSFIIFTDLNLGFSNQLDDALTVMIDSHTRFSVYFGSITKISENEVPSYFLNYAKFISKIPFYIPLIEQNFDYEKEGPITDFQRFFYFSYSGIFPYYYYVDIGNMRMIFIDTIKSQLNKGFYFKQIEWLKNILSSTTKDWLVIVSNSNIYPENPEETTGFERMIDIINNNNVDFVIQFGSFKYARKKSLTTDTLILWVGENNVEVRQDANFFDFISNVDGIIKFIVNQKRIDIIYLDYNLKEVDHLVYQK